MRRALSIFAVATMLAAACNRAVDSPPSVPAEHLEAARRAKASFERGDYREAEKIFEAIVAAVPNNLCALSNLGVVRFRAGKFKESEEAFKRAIALAPADGFSHCTLGIVYYSQGRYDEAVNALTKALAINPKDATAHRYLAIVAAAKGWGEAARKELEALEPSGNTAPNSPDLGDFLTPLEKSRFKLPGAPEMIPSR
jgi:Flp pilus assembly protein TadD